MARRKADRQRRDRGASQQLHRFTPKLFVFVVFVRTA
jgi:hypothetical protein